jgi:hypothetical protein
VHLAAIHVSLVRHECDVAIVGRETTLACVVISRSQSISLRSDTWLPARGTTTMTPVWKVMNLSSADHSVRTMPAPGV